MSKEDSFVFGSVYYFGAMEDLARIFTDAGFKVEIGQWAIHIDYFARAFELGYVGNLDPECPFSVDGNGYDFPVDVLAANCARLAECLRRNGIGFDFTHMSGDQQHELGSRPCRTPPTRMNTGLPVRTPMARTPRNESNGAQFPGVLEPWRLTTSSVPDSIR